ncbi:MAG: TatD family hydrolase [Polyangiaceae bacterium]|nr:TatD family hydrolase [Polyangiaceae bacterium]
MLIDSHCHLDGAGIASADDAIARAKAAGVGFFVVIGVGETLDSARFAIELARGRSDVRAIVGVHPHDASVLDDAMFAELEELARAPEVVAVGEMGLDYHYMRSPMEVQKAAFRRQIALARDVKKPICVHTRLAPDDTIAILKDEHAADVGGIIHCFSEDKAFAERALDLEFDLSFSGIVTFKSATSVHEVAAWAPADRILIETDSPYLAPVPVRGKPCEPAFLVHTAKRVASLRNIAFEELAHLTRANTARRLNLPG